MICRQCQDRRNEEIRQWVRENGPLSQGVDPDGLPARCTVDGCTKDAVMVTRMFIDGRDLLLYSCNDHCDTMTELIAELRSGQSTIDWGDR